MQELSVSSKHITFMTKTHLMRMNLVSLIGASRSLAASSITFLTCCFPSPPIKNSCSCKTTSSYKTHQNSKSLNKHRTNLLVSTSPVEKSAREQWPRLVIHIIVRKCLTSTCQPAAFCHSSRVLLFVQHDSAQQDT